MLRVGIVGAGNVGQAVGKAFDSFGCKVVFMDIDKVKIQVLKEQGYNAVTSLPKTCESSDILFVTVPTPTKVGEFDYSFVKDALFSIKKCNYNGFVCIKSTVVPGTTREICESLKLDKSKTFVNPEFLREKTALGDFINQKFIVIGTFNWGNEKEIVDFYELFYKCPISIMTIEEAEFTKYISNTFLSMKISFWNEMKRVFDIYAKQNGVDGDITKVAKILSLDQRIGEYGTYEIGKGWSGACFPKDCIAFNSLLRKNGIYSPFVEQIIAVNNMTPEGKKAIKKVVGASLEELLFV